MPCREPWLAEMRGFNTQVLAIRTVSATDLSWWTTVFISVNSWHLAAGLHSSAGDRLVALAFQHGLGAASVLLAVIPIHVLGVRRFRVGETEERTRNVTGSFASSPVLAGGANWSCAEGSFFMECTA